MQKGPDAGGTGKTDANTTIEELKTACAEFKHERGWEKYNTPRNLAISIAIEAAELLEHFQWDTEDTEANKQALAGELADVFTYCLQFAHASGIDVTTAFYDKLAHSKQKYPVEIFNRDSASRESYYKIKSNYREGRKGM